MRLPKIDGTYPESDDEIYADQPATKRLGRAALLALMKEIIDNDEDGFIIAGAKASSEDDFRVSDEVHEAYEREAKRIADHLSTSLGKPIVSQMEEVGFIGYRWTVDGVPIVLFPYQEDSDLPLELFIARVTPQTAMYIAPSLTKKASAKPLARHSTARKPSVKKNASARKASATSPRSRKKTSKRRRNE